MAASRDWPSEPENELARKPDGREVSRDNAAGTRPDTPRQGGPPQTGAAAGTVMSVLSPWNALERLDWSLRWERALQRTPGPECAYGS